MTQLTLDEYATARNSVCNAIGCERPAFFGTTLCRECGKLPGPLGVPARIWAQIRFTPAGCWLWTGHANRTGYGQVMIDRRSSVVHRAIYEAAKGPVDLDLDHLCRNRACCNPDHLEPVTNRENSLRGAASGIGTSRLLGVSWDSRRKKWRAQLNHTYLGRFASEVEAAAAYDEAVRRHHGEDATTNASLGLMGSAA